MVLLNGDVIFVDTSGMIRAINSDLTLRANEAGGGHIIIGSGISLRPDVNCDASDAIDLGQKHLRWKTLFACSGNFLDRPTVNGSGVLLQGEAAAVGGGSAGVNTLNGISGVVTLASVNDAITITENGQIIEFSGVFTQISGTLLENIADLVGSGVVNRLNGLSGLVDLISPDGSIIITPSGQNIALQIDPQVVEQLVTLSGITQLARQVSLPLITTTSLVLIEAVSLDIPIDISGLYRMAWSMEIRCTQANKVCQFVVDIDDIGASGGLFCMDINTSFNVAAGNLASAGFIFLNLGPGIHIMNVSLRYNDTGIAAAELVNIHLESIRTGPPSGIS